MLNDKYLFSWLLKTLKPSIATFFCYRDLAKHFNSLNQTKWCTLTYLEYLPGLRKKKKWMRQNKVGKLTSCAHWWEKRNMTSFYILGLFQTVTANVAIGKKIFNDDSLFEGAICKDSAKKLERNTKLNEIWNWKENKGKLLSLI